MEFASEFEKEMYEKFTNGIELTGSEMYTLCTKYKYAERLRGYGMRLSALSTVVKVLDKYLCINWNKANLKDEQSFLNDQPYEVRPVEKQTMVTHWLPVTADQTAN